jgi:hypothetical protein
MARPEISLEERLSAVALNQPQLRNAQFLNMTFEFSPISMLPDTGSLLPVDFDPSRVSSSS